MMLFLVLKMIYANWLLDWFIYRLIEAKSLAHAIVEFVIILYILITLILWLVGMDSHKRRNEIILGVVLLLVFEAFF